MIPDLRFYVLLFLRRLHYFLVIALAVSAVGITLAYTLPPVYRAQARLLVESPQIPDDLASSTVRAGAPELLQIIQQRLLTRANLLDLSRRFNIHAARPEMSADDIVSDMVKRAQITLPSARDTAGVVIVSFAAPTGLLSSQVTNELVTQILDENVKLRTAVTGETLDFFEQAVTRLDAELARQGGLILDFKLKNKEALPESLDYRRTRQASQQERLSQIDRELAGLRDRRARLSELYERTGRIDNGTDTMTPEQQQLQKLEDQLASALVIYSPQNPRVKAFQAQVEALEKVVNAQLGAGVEGAPQLSTFDLQVADIDGQIAYLAEQKTSIEAELAELARTIDETPGNAIALGSLERDYENIRVQYNQAVADLGQARTGDQIELTSKGQRISVVEQAIVPSVPDSPNRRRIAVTGVVGGMAAGLGFIVLLELLNRSIRRPVEISRRLGITPFATFPFIRTDRQIRARRAIIAFAMLTVCVGIPLSLYLLHTYYLPIDMLIAMVLDKTGIDTLIGQLQ